MTTEPGMRTALAINLELGGRHAASVRVELLQEPGEAQVAHVALSGWIDGAAERRLERALDELKPREISRVVLDCSCVSMLERPAAARLLEAVARFEGRPGGIEVRGMPRTIRGARTP
jgi:hypothetical protein